MKIDLDLSSLDYFWYITEKLEDGKEPNKEEWEELFKKPGYRALSESEFYMSFFIKAFTLAFNPKKKAKFTEALESNIGRYLRYYQEVKNNKIRIKSNVQKIKENWQRLTDTIETRTFSILPPMDMDEVPTVSILIFDKDARGGYGTIVIDAIFADYFENFVTMTAHELFHFYRNKLLCYDPDKINPQDKDLMWIINQLHSEGLADQIDKDFFIYSKVENPFPHSYREKFKSVVSNARELIKQVNKKIEEIAQENGEKRDIKIKELKQLIPLAGHPLGYYLVNTCIKENLIDELIKNVGNPFSLFRTYNKAAETDREDLPLFSNQTLDFIQILEQKYCSKEKQK